MNPLLIPDDRDFDDRRLTARRDLLVAEIERRSRRRRVGRGMAVVAAAAVVTAVGVVAPLTRHSDEGRVFAYVVSADDELTYEFSFEFLTTSRPVGTLPEGATIGSDILQAASGEMRYATSEGPQPGTVNVSISATGDELNAFGDDIGRDRPSPADWPAVSAVVDHSGHILESDPDEFDWFLAADPTSSQRDDTIIPFAFGPPFPSNPLDIGDSWTTQETSDECDPAATATERPCEPGTQVDGVHEVVRSEEIAGRSTVVIRSTYSQREWGAVEFTDSSNVATVWFDPEHGVVVKVEWQWHVEFTMGLAHGFDGQQQVSQTKTLELSLIDA